MPKGDAVKDLPENPPSGVIIPAQTLETVLTFFGRKLAENLWFALQGRSDIELDKLCAAFESALTHIGDTFPQEVKPRFNAAGQLMRLTANPYTVPPSVWVDPVDQSDPNVKA